MERPDFNQWKAREVARLLALVESERRYYQEIVATLPVPLVVLSADRLAISANRAFRQAFQLRGEDLRSHSIDQLVPVPELAARIQEAQTKGTPSEPLVAKVGERTLRICVVPVRDWNGDNALETLLSVEDLGAAETRPPVPVDLPAILWQADAETLQFRSAHGSVEEMLGYPVAHWTSMPNFFEERIHAEDRPATLALYRSAIDRGGDASAEFRAVSAAGALVWCRESIRVAPSASAAETPRAIIGVITNIARRKELEGQWLSAARTEALQTLAGRLAHDLNNPLMVIAGYTEDVLFSLAADDPRRADLGQVLTASGRVGEVTHRLVEFGRKQARPAEQVNLNPLLGDLEPEIARAAGAGVAVDMLPPSNDLWALANGAQLTEVILALVGSHEGSHDRTRLIVSWESDIVAESVGSTLSPGCYSRIALRDDGRGMTSPQRAALFDAVLVPKDASAPGPALSRAYQMVREWGGGITVQNTPIGGGNTYWIYLPHVDAPVAAEPTPALPVVPIPVAAPEPQRETILVVDDEAGIRGLMRKILKREHYRVLEAGNAEEALAVALTHAGPIDLLLTDVMMPGLTGPELARRMCEATPNLKVLFISGYAPDEALQSGSLAAGHSFLAKPFTLGALVGKVRETLDAPVS